MKNPLYLGLLITCMLMGSCTTLQNLVTAPSGLETLTAVKEVLNSSAFKSLDKLAAVSNEGLIGVLPDEVKPIVNTLKTLGLGKELDELDQKVAKASGAVLFEGKGLMADAIKEFKPADAVAIVTGQEDAATIALKNAMYGAVKNRYSARLDNKLSEIPETKHWETALSTYNLFAKNKIEGSLSDFIAERAVDAVFIGMGKEEAVIRKDPASIGKDVVTRVFDYYKNN